jgi:hypothetical protein
MLCKKATVPRVGNGCLIAMVETSDYFFFFEAAFFAATFFAGAAFFATTFFFAGILRMVMFDIGGSSTFTIRCLTRVKKREKNPILFFITFNHIIVLLFDIGPEDHCVICEVRECIKD